MLITFSRVLLDFLIAAVIQFQSQEIYHSVVSEVVLAWHHHATSKRVESVPNFTHIPSSSQLPWHSNQHACIVHRRSQWHVRAPLFMWQKFVWICPLSPSCSCLCSTMYHLNIKDCKKMARQSQPTSLYWEMWNVSAGTAEGTMHALSQRRQNLDFSCSWMGLKTCRALFHYNT